LEELCLNSPRVTSKQCYDFVAASPNLQRLQFYPTGDEHVVLPDMSVRAENVEVLSLNCRRDYDNWYNALASLFSHDDSFPALVGLRVSGEGERACFVALPLEKLGHLVRLSLVGAGIFDEDLQVRGERSFFSHCGSDLLNGLDYFLLWLRSFFLLIGRTYTFQKIAFPMRKSPL